MGRELTDFHKWFPQMAILTFHGINKVIDRKCIEKSFPWLGALDIHMEKKQQKSFTRGNIMKALRLNPYLTRLWISGNAWDAKLLQNMSKHLQRLQLLIIKWTDRFCNLKKGTDHFKKFQWFFH